MFEWLKFVCDKCGKRKVWLLAKWFGLNHCEDCELEPLNKAIALVKAQIDFKKQEVALLENRINNKERCQEK